MSAKRADILQESTLPCDYYQLPHPGIRSLHPYIPGKSIEETARELRLTNVIKMASNENPLGCSPLVNKALAKLTTRRIANYPSPMNHPLMLKLSEKLGISNDMLTLGNGSDFLFFILLTTFAANTGKHILTHEYAFIAYPIQAQTLAIPVSIVPLKPDWQVDIAAIINHCSEQTAMIFLANPNNPTGTCIPLNDIKYLLAHIPSSTLLVLDEAYYDYAYQAGDKRSIHFINEHPNLIITRTFSKVYGLAGLRLGYAIANPDITALVQRVQPPFVVNQAALTAAYAALDDDGFVQQSIELNNKGKQQLFHGLHGLGINYLPSNGNFVTIDCRTDSQLIYQSLLEQGIIVRPLNQYGLPNHLRITIGTMQQNSLLLDKLAIALAENNKQQGGRTP